MEEKHIVVARFPDSLEAHLAMGLLEVEEVPCYLVDENIVATLHLHVNAVGGVKLMVPESYADRAGAIIQEHWQKQREYAAVAARRCPRCQGERVGMNSVGIGLVLLAAITFGLAWLLFYRTHRCDDCGFTW